MYTNMVNVSNHSSLQFSEKQLAASGSVRDIRFPAVPTDATKDDVLEMAKELVRKVNSLVDDLKGHDLAILINGEPTLVVATVALLQDESYNVVAGCSDRVSEENEDGTKTSKFVFVQYREY